MRELPCPFTEGKTACGQVEKNQLYHRIWVVPDGCEREERPSDFGGIPNRLSTRWRPQLEAYPLAPIQVTGFNRSQLRVCCGTFPANRDHAAERPLADLVHLSRRKASSGNKAREAAQTPCGRAFLRVAAVAPGPEYRRPKPVRDAPNPAALRGAVQNPELANLRLAGGPRLSPASVSAR
jgi:hypothetical protein